MSNVIQFPRKHKIETDYERLYNSMDRMELLEEMVRFQEKRSQIGRLTPELIAQGIPLFHALHHAAETQELRILTGSYLRHLKEEQFNGSNHSV